jgi:hypothetical protein
MKLTRLKKSQLIKKTKKQLTRGSRVKSTKGNDRS